MSLKQQFFSQKMYGTLLNKSRTPIPTLVTTIDDCTRWSGLQCFLVRLFILVIVIVKLTKSYEFSSSLSLLGLKMANFRHRHRQNAEFSSSSLSR